MGALWFTRPRHRSVTMFDLYVNPSGLDVLLQRTVVNPRNNDTPLPVFNNARPPQ